MLLIAGLGNPGARHAKNRHNIGFMAVERDRRGRIASGRSARASRGTSPKGRSASERVALLMPQTYMNESGRSVGEAMRFYKLGLDAIVVIHDELDLAPAKVRVKVGGGAAGHNGLRSITAHIGNDYKRVRLGHRPPRRQGAGLQLRARRLRQVGDALGSKRCATRWRAPPTCS